MIPGRRRKFVTSQYGQRVGYRHGPVLSSSRRHVADYLSKLPIGSDEDDISCFRQFTDEGWNLLVGTDRVFRE